jgi:hypothetical protein
MPGKFHRPLEIEAEWQSLGSPDDEKFWERLARARVETVVAARRQYCDRDRSLVDRIDRVLVAKIDPLFRAASRSVAKHEAPSYREEIEAMLGEDFWRDVLTAEDTFYEIRCRQKLRKVALDARRKVIDAKARTLERRAARIEHPAVEDATPAGTVAEETIPDPADDFAEVEAEIDWYVALASMPDEVAQAIDLHYRADLKVHSNNPDEPTVSKILGCSERKARDLIRTGEELARRQIEGLSDKEAP